MHEVAARASVIFKKSLSLGASVAPSAVPRQVSAAVNGGGDVRCGDGQNGFFTPSRERIVRVLPGGRGGGRGGRRGSGSGRGGGCSCPCRAVAKSAPHSTTNAHAALLDG